MRRAFAVFFYLLSTLLIIASTPIFSNPDNSGLWFFWIYAIQAVVYCVVLTILFTFSKYEMAPRRPYLAALIALSAAGPLLFSENPSPRTIAASFPVFLIISFFVTCAWQPALRPHNFERIRRILAPAFAVAGCGLVFSSLFFTISQKPGWAILFGREKWITAYFNPGTFDLSEKIPGSSALFGYFGYAMYVLMLLSAAAFLIVTLKARFSADALSGNRLARAVSCVLSFTGIWFLQDIYWGWHFDLADHRYAASAGILAWALALGFGAVTFWRLARGESDDWAGRTIVLLQLPFITFNFMMSPGYFETTMFTYFPGLGLLLFGSQLLMWACGAVLVQSGQPAPAMLSKSVAGA